MAGIFLKAEWRKLAIANYEVSPDLLQPYLPYKTELDLWQNKCYVSLVGFMFLNTQLKGIPIPFHRNFEEVNLRFYVKYQEGDLYKRGVVFIKEIVPKPALAWVANAIYKEKYQTMKMDHAWKTEGSFLSIEYRWKKESWNSFRVKAGIDAIEIQQGSEEEFITEHYWGYTKINSNKTSEYEVTHPRWKVYPIHSFSIDIDFRKVYGEEFAFLQDRKPISVFLAEGSEIAVKDGRMI
jgi:uncharacterized protein